MSNSCLKLWQRPWHQKWNCGVVILCFKLGKPSRSTLTTYMCFSGKDNMLPSVDESRRLSTSLQNCRILKFKDNGHTILLVCEELFLAYFFLFFLIFVCYVSGVLYTNLFLRQDQFCYLYAQNIAQVEAVRFS